VEGAKCPECGRRTFRLIYPKRKYGTCTTCGSSFKSIGDDVGFPNIQIFKPLLDQNIDGTDRYFTSKRKHVDCLKRHNLICKHYV